MQEPLESIIEKTAGETTQIDVTPQKPTLIQELKEYVKHYPQNWMEYMKGLIPTLIVSTAGAVLAPEILKELEYTSGAIKLLGSYILGYGLGYSTAFGVEYFRHKEKYPNGIFSKEFKNYVVSFLAADYVADLSVFQTTMLTANYLLGTHTEFNDMERMGTAWFGAGLCWISAMAGLHPITKRVNEYINTQAKKVYNTITRKNTNNISS